MMHGPRFLSDWKIMNSVEFWKKSSSRCCRRRRLGPTLRFLNSFFTSWRKSSTRCANFGRIKCGGGSQSDQTNKSGGGLFICVKKRRVLISCQKRVKYSSIIHVVYLGVGQKFKPSPRSWQKFGGGFFVVQRSWHAMLLALLK